MRGAGTTSMYTLSPDVAMCVRTEIQCGESHVDREDFARDAIA
jgi:hypothetical protein